MTIIEKIYNKNYFEILQFFWVLHKFTLMEFNRAIALISY